MDKSQRRLSGKTALTSGQRHKVVVGLMLAVAIAGLFMYEPASHQPPTSDVIIANSDCNIKPYAETDGTSECPSVAIAATDPQISDPAAPDTNSPVLTDKNTKGSQGRHASVARMRHNTQSNSASPRPGYTMAELCSADTLKNVTSCKTGSYETIIDTPEAAATSDSTSGYSISGRVVTADRGGVSDVTLIASPDRLKDKTETYDSKLLRFWTVSDSLGNYSLDGLPEGEYTIRSATHGPYQSARISARTGVDYADLVVSMNSAAIVEGRVLTAFGAALEGVTVLPILLGQPSVLTGDDGRFRLPVTLKPGINSFALRFQRPGFSEQSTKVILENAAGQSPRAHSVEPHYRRHAGGDAPCRILDRIGWSGI